MQNSYLFYDIETSGLNHCFDQVLQFAAIRTDLELRELEQHEFFIKLNPDVIPSPTAMLVHQLTIEQIQRGICEYEAFLEIHRLFNASGTISVGYNNLGFDDEFLRFSFYRNLLSPYTHQYANNCGRMDIYPMLVMYYLFKPLAIAWPKINDVVTLKLEHLNRQNELTVGNAHEAMNDVKATVELARLLKKEQKMWEYLCGCFNKKSDLARWEKLNLFINKYKLALLVDGGFGVAKFYQCPAIGIGMHHHYKNQSLWLPLDLFSFAEITDDNIATTTFIKRKRFGEPPLLLPLTAHYSHYLSEASHSLMAANLDWVQKNPELFAKVVLYHQEYKYPEVPKLDVDAALYQVGFMQESDQFKCNNFHAASPQGKVSLLSNFTTPGLRTQALRILGRNYPEVLAAAEDKNLVAEFIAYLNVSKSSNVIVDYRNKPRLIPQAALIEIENLLQEKNLNSRQSNLLAELSKYIQR